MDGHALEESRSATDSESLNEGDSVSEPNYFWCFINYLIRPSPFSYPEGPVTILESDVTLLDFFSLFFDHSIIDHIVDQPTKPI